MDWGSVPGWVEAIGTVGAFLAALLLLRAEQRSRFEIRDRQAQEEARQLRFDIREIGGARGTSRDVVVTACNDAPHAVFRGLEMWLLEEPDAESASADFTIDTVRPGEHRSIPLLIDWVAKPAWVVTGTYLDAADVEWFRDGYGGITRVDQESLRPKRGLNRRLRQWRARRARARSVTAARTP